MNEPTIAAVLLSGVIAAPFAMAQSVAPDNAKSNQADASNKTANIAGGDKVTDDLKVAPTK